MPFSPSRLVVARERRGLFAKELADKSGVSPQTISYWESGSGEPGLEALSRLADALAFPEVFFSRPGIDRLQEGAASFRARTKLAAKQRNAALATGDLACELVDWIEARFTLPVVDLPDLRGQDPELAAQVVRAEWTLGEKPIPNMIHLLESRGVIVFSIAQDCRELDAFSFWFKGRPVVMLNNMKGAERSRMDAAHELGHLVAHHEKTGKKEEGEADAFAGAFLMPERGLRNHVPRVIGLNDLIQRKKTWGVSLASLVYRLHKIGIVQPWQYRSLFMELSKRGYRLREPEPVGWDRSVLLPRLFDALRAEGFSPRRVAAELGWPVSDLRQFLLGLGAGLVSLQGGASGANPGTRDHVRIV